MKLKILFFIIICIGISSDSYAKDDTNVSSDNMVYSANKQEVTFTGNVYVKNKDLELWADRIIIYLDNKQTDKQSPASEMQAGEIDRIVANSNVRFTSGTYKGKSSKATYTAKNGKIVLEGNPILSDDVNSLSGEIINYYLNENRAEVQSGKSKRVEATFSTNNKDLGKLSPTP